MSTPAHSYWQDFARLPRPAIEEAFCAHIYVLYDPRDDRARYVGKSIRPLERLANHINESPSNCHRSHWIQELRALGLKPILEVVESIYSADEELWKHSERWWISQLKALGCNLVNNTDGGDGVTGLPAETRERMRRTWLGRKHKPETIEKLKGHFGPRHSAEHKAKMSRLMTGRKITWLDKIAEANRKITTDQALDIAARLLRGEKGIALAREFGVHRTTISKIKLGKYFIGRRGTTNA